MSKNVNQKFLKTKLRGVLKNSWRRIPAHRRARLMSGASGVAITKIRRSIGKSSGGFNYGLLSVVIPVYNVEAYLEECVLSVVGQTYKRLQIILVDDGSTDGSLRLAKKLARVDRRICVISKKNNGLGSARNTGIARARGKYIAFVDSDDIVPKKAYQVMLESLNTTGSDFVVGSINRLIGKKRSKPQWAQEVHAEDRLHITLSEYPEILHNVFAWNKVFIKEFWDKILISFPEGVLYEDQELTAKAYNEAQAFDVLKSVVYDWRIRSDRSSITQQKDNVVDLSDRLLVTSRVNDYLLASVSTATYEYWLVKVLGTDLSLYYVQIPRVGDDYWRILQSRLGHVLESVPPEVLEKVDVHERLLLNCIKKDNRADFERIIYWNSENGRSFPYEVVSDRLYARPGYVQEMGFVPSSDLLATRPENLKIIGELDEIRPGENGLLEVYCSAYVLGLDLQKMDLGPSFRLMNVGTGKTHALKYSARVDPHIDVRANDAWTSYSNSSFKLLIHANELSYDIDSSVREEWRLDISFNILGTTIHGGLTSRSMTGAGALFPLLSVDDDGGRWICRYSKALGLSFLRENYRCLMERVSIKGRRVSCSVPSASRDSFSHLLFECRQLGLQAIGSKRSDSSGVVSFDCDLPELPKRAREFDAYVWRVRAVTNEGRAYDVGLRAAIDWHQNSGDQCCSLEVRPSGLGYVQLSDRRSIVRVENWSVDTELETVSLTIGYSEGSVSPRQNVPRIFFANGRNQINAMNSSWIVPGVTAEHIFGLRGPRWDSLTTSVESGMYTLRHVGGDESGTDHVQWTEVAPSAQSGLPEHHSTKNVNLTLARTPQASALSLRIGPPLGMSERGKLMQARLHRSIPDLLMEPILDGAVLFESFGGKTIGDSPLALFEEMIRRGDTRPKYWSVSDHSVVVPQGAQAVVMYSKEWYRVLHTAEFVVNNNNFPFFYRKHDKQKYIQTWHGTPLKRIGNDIPTSTLSLAYIKLMKKESEYWDYLLAQNDFAERVLPNAFGYAGEVLNLGYPRNDILSSPDAESRSREVREALGISAGKTVILYAPTWRDNSRNENNQYAFVNYLDVDEATSVLGENYVFLIRGHHNVAQQRTSLSGRNVLDVTSRPNINDLILASDCLVTDYSSVMFDYVVTGKPLYFLVPDMEAYKTQVRGFYFNFDEGAPGPLVGNTAALVGHLLNNTASSSIADKYAEFCSTYAGSDDGLASARVYEHVWLSQF